MIVSLKIKDETYEAYSKFDPSNPRLAMEQQLERFKTSSPKDREIIINAPLRQELEKLLGRQVDTAKALVDLVGLMVNIKVGEVEIPLTEGQMKRIASQAAFWKQDPTKFTKDKVKAGIVTALGV